MIGSMEEIDRLAAALRYQLGGQDHSVPSYSTVVLDEAFDEADAKFTAAAMTIFKTFGLRSHTTMRQQGRDRKSVV